MTDGGHGHLDGKSIVVTGAGSGIGRAIAFACAAEGANVIVADYGVTVNGDNPSSKVADVIAREITDGGGTAVAVADTVTTMEGGRRIVHSAIKRWGHIDGVVCAAGILRLGTISKMSEDEWDAVVETHLKGHFTVFRAASAIMREQGSGALIGFTSGAFAGSILQPNYSAAKGGIVSLVRSAAAGLYRYGVTANCIAPIARTRMATETGLDTKAVTDLDGGEPEDVAPLVVFLLSDRARHITGQVYTAHGSKIAVWNQPAEVRAMFTDGHWSVETIATRIDTQLGQERLAILDRLEMRSRDVGKRTQDLTSQDGQFFADQSRTPAPPMT